MPCDLCFTEGSGKMINSCRSWLRADQERAVSHILRQIKGLHTQPAVSAHSSGIFLSNDNICSGCFSCGACYQLGDLNLSRKETIIYTLISLDCNSETAFTKSQLPHRPSASPGPLLLAFHSGFLSVTVTHAVLVLNSIFLQDLGLVYLKELEKITRRKITVAAYLLGLTSSIHRGEAAWVPAPNASPILCHRCRAMSTDKSSQTHQHAKKHPNK